MVSVLLTWKNGTLTVLGMLSLSYYVMHLCDVIVLVNVFE